MCRGGGPVKLLEAFVRGCADWIRRGDLEWCPFDDDDDNTSLLSIEGILPELLMPPLKPFQSIIIIKRCSYRYRTAATDYE